MTDPSTLADWWSKGFDAFFDGVSCLEQPEGENSECCWEWVRGWCKAEEYRDAMKGLPS